MRWLAAALLIGLTACGNDGREFDEASFREWLAVTHPAADADEAAAAARSACNLNDGAFRSLIVNADAQTLAFTTAACPNRVAENRSTP